MAIKSTSLCIPRNSVKGALRDSFQAPVGNPNLRARPQSLPERVHPARQAHQPLGPRTASRPQAAPYRGKRGAPFRAESTPVSQRSQHPVEKPPKSTLAHRSSRQVTTRSPQQPRAELCSGSRGPAQLTLTWSQRPTRLTFALHTPSRRRHLKHPTPGQTPSMLTLHVVGKDHFYLHVGSNVPEG